ncbi:MAG: Maf family protein [Methylophilaceae bacterium]
MNPKIYLASQSPRRAELLKQMGVDYIKMPANIDELPLKNELPIDYVLRVARQKAEVCVQALGYVNLPILAADTTVVLNDKVLGKPLDDDDARAMLSALSGRVHVVHTAVALAYQHTLEVVLSSTNVEMMPLSNSQIEAYIATGEHRDKAGSYGIQGLAAMWIKRIEGSYTGVMGLPLFETTQLLRKAGVMTL